MPSASEKPNEYLETSNDPVNINTPLWVDDFSILLKKWTELYPYESMNSNSKHNAIVRFIIVMTFLRFIMGGNIGSTVIFGFITVMLSTLYDFASESSVTVQPVVPDNKGFHDQKDIQELKQTEITGDDRDDVSTSMSGNNLGPANIRSSNTTRVYSTRPLQNDEKSDNDIQVENTVGTGKFVSTYT